MAEETIRLPVRSALVPVFYKNFRCLVQDCRDSCCVGWRITFDKKDYLRLRRLDAPEALRERLEQGVRREKKKTHDGVFYGKFDLDSNSSRCPFLDTDGLCAIQRSCGHDALPHVCKTYPRKVVYTPAAREYALSPSCEGVLQQLWELPEGVEFVEDPLPRAEEKNVHVPPGENLIFYFTPIRALCVDILQNRSMPLSRRMLCLGMILQRLQNADWTAFDPDGWVEQAAADVDRIAAMRENIQGNRDMYVMQNLNVLDAITAEKDHWTTELYKTLEVQRKATLTPQKDGGFSSKAKVTTTYSRKAYEEALEHFQTAFGDQAYFFENLMAATALYLDFPDLTGKEALWKSYVSLCNLYSFFRFVSVVGCKGNATKERLFHFLVMASRATLHNRNRFHGFQKDLFQHNSSTLAHMAILLDG